MASFDVPLDIGFECWPPEAVEEGAAHGVESFVSELVVCIADEGVAVGWRGIELVSALGLMSLESSADDEETAGSAKEECERIT